jgi:hypothetical protein
MRALLGACVAEELSKTEVLRLKRSRIRKHTGTDQQYEYCLHEHLPYEINMFRALFTALALGLPKDSLTRNAFIESFFIHARNLIAFLKNDSDCGFDPRYFTKTNYNPNTSFVPTKLWKKIIHQVAHLLPERTHVSSEKLGPKDRKDISDLIERELGRFESALTDEYRAKWPVKPASIPAAKLDAGQASATNHIIVMTNAGETTYAGRSFYKIINSKDDTELR